MGTTPLLAAIVAGHLRIAEILLEVGADVDCKQNAGETPLHIAALKGYSTISLMLQERGAKV